MFSLLNGVYDDYLAPPQLNLLIVGAPSVGKTTLLERLKVTQIPRRPSKAGPLTPPPLALTPALHEAFCKGGAEAPAETETPISETTTTTTGSSETDDSNSVAGKPEFTPTKPAPVPVIKQKRRFQLSICPAPERYSRTAQDQEEDFVVEEPEPVQPPPPPPTSAAHATTSDQVEDGSGEEIMPLDMPTSPEAPRRVRCHSKEFSVEELDIINSAPNNHYDDPRTTSMESIPLDDIPKLPSLRPHNPALSSTTDKSPLLQNTFQECHIKPKAKMLPMSKIRPTSKSLLLFFRRIYGLGRGWIHAILLQYEDGCTFSRFRCTLFFAFYTLVGTNLGKIEMYGAKCHLFDVGGRLQDLWERYYDDCDAVIFCWRLGEDPEAPTKEEEEGDDDVEDLFDMSKQQEILNQVRKSISDDVPFLVFGHVFGNANVELVDNMYATDAVLPHYHNNLTGMCCGSAKTGAGVQHAMDWLIPLAKRQQKERVAARKKLEEEKEL
jgi:hypothetical protein